MNLLGPFQLRVSSEILWKSCENAMLSLEDGEDLDLDLTATSPTCLSLLDFK